MEYIYHLEMNFPSIYGITVINGHYCLLMVMNDMIFNGYSWLLKVMNGYIYIWMYIYGCEYGKYPTYAAPNHRPSR